MHFRGGCLFQEQFQIELSQRGRGHGVWCPHKPLTPWLKGLLGRWSGASRPCCPRGCPGCCTTQHGLVGGWWGGSEQCLLLEECHVFPWVQALVALVLPSIPVRCYANNTITKTQHRNKRKTFCSRGSGREDQSQTDILLLDHFGEEWNSLNPGLL